MLVRGRAERQIKVVEIARRFAGTRYCWREPAGRWAGRVACKPCCLQHGPAPSSTARTAFHSSRHARRDRDRPAPRVMGRYQAAARTVPWRARERRGVVAGQPGPCTGLGHAAPFLRQARLDGSEQAGAAGAIRILVVEAMLLPSWCPQGLLARSGFLSPSPRVLFTPFPAQGSSGV